MYLFRNILRISAVLSCLCLAVFLVLEGCGGMSGGDDDLRDDNRLDRQDRLSRRGGPDGRGNRNRGNEDLGNTDDSGGQGFRSDDDEEIHPDSEETREVITIHPSDDQRNLSNKIDFLFILDASRSNQDYIEESVIQKKLGTFIEKLDQENINWRIYTTSGETDKDEPLYNGKLHELEHRGTIIPFLYLDNEVLSADNARDPKAYISEVFIDTISHPKRRNCDMPPFCYKDKENRPLKALSGFLNVASRYELLRNDADLVVIIISNQDERPSETKPKEPFAPTYIQDQLQEDFSDKTWHAITFVVRSTDSNCTDGKASSNIPQLARLTGGLTASICSNTYAQTIIDFIREKQGKAVARRRVFQQKQEESHRSLKDDIYGGLKRR
ncbi:MAG: hypothetical protein OXK80_05110 [Bdellovibrionales bacterium]|nr:hypothetical protein [Bdellovibrionales bacterium]